MWTTKTLIRLGGCPGWSEPSPGAQSFCWFCQEAAHIIVDFSLNGWFTSVNRFLHTWWKFPCDWWGHGSLWGGAVKDECCGTLISFLSIFTSVLCLDMIWATSWENLLMPYVNNKGADQPAHLCSLISAFVVRYLDSIIPLLAIAKISRP